MPKSSVSKKHKQYKKKKAAEKQLIKHKIKKMKESLNETPKTFVYGKNAKTVEVPLQQWQVLNQVANRLQDIAMFVTTMEDIGRLHIDNGTLKPVFESDLEPVIGQKNPDGSQAMKIKDSFWDKRSVLEKPTIIKADGVTVYEESSKV